MEISGGPIYSIGRYVCYTYARDNPSVDAHTPEWFDALRRLDPEQAAMTAQIIKLAGHSDVCSICGEPRSKPYIMVAEPALPIRLCDDCLRIQKEMHGASFDPL